MRVEYCHRLVVEALRAHPVGFEEARDNLSRLTHEQHQMHEQSGPAGRALAKRHIAERVVPATIAFLRHPRFEDPSHKMGELLRVSFEKAVEFARVDQPNARLYNTLACVAAERMVERGVVYNPDEGLRLRVLRAE